MVTTLESKRTAMFENRGSVQRLGADVCNVTVSSHLSQNNASVPDQLLNPEVAYLNVLGSPDAFPMQHVHRGLRVDAHCDIHGDSQITKQGLHSQCL